MIKPIIIPMPEDLRGRKIFTVTAHQWIQGSRTNPRGGIALTDHSLVFCVRCETTEKLAYLEENNTKCFPHSVFEGSGFLPET